MNFTNFFNSYIGMYLAESFFHSLISIIIVERALHAWEITSPLIRQRFRFIAILFPIFSFPIFQAVNPERNSISFRLEALLDINRWLNLELWGKIPLSLIFILGICLTTAIFIFQELIPVIRHTLKSKGTLPQGKISKGNSVVDKALEHLSVERPDIFIVEGEEFILFSSTGSKPAVFLSTGFIEELDTEQLQAAIAHEIAHIIRSKRPLLIIVFLLRILMFFNPVVLVGFRKTVQEEEKICDDIAVSLTHKPYALAQTLRKFYLSNEDPLSFEMKKLSNLTSKLEEYGHHMQISNRILRLEQGIIPNPANEWFKFVLTLIVITLINYFVV